MEAIPGAALTLTITPFGSCTGMALPRSVRQVQNRRPTGPPISGWIGKSKAAAAIATIAAAEVARTSPRTLTFTDYFP
jgi:hypothetical protein